jgi:hypothetical protein
MSNRMHRLYARIPGDPMGRTVRLNERLCAPLKRQDADPELETAEPAGLPRAA